MFYETGDFFLKTVFAQDVTGPIGRHGFYVWDDLAEGSLDYDEEEWRFDDAEELTDAEGELEVFQV